MYKMSKRIKRLLKLQCTDVSPCTFVNLPESRNCSLRVKTKRTVLSCFINREPINWREGMCQVLCNVTVRYTLGEEEIFPTIRKTNVSTLCGPCG